MMTTLLLLLLSLANAAPTRTYDAKDYGHEFATGLVWTAQAKDFIKNAPAASFIHSTAAIPDKYSLRGHAGPVRNQGQCGSCWDFSLTTALRGTLKMAGHDPGPLSFNYLLNCNSSGYGCGGGNFDAADDLVRPKGPPRYGADGEYTQSEGQCVHKPAVASTKAYKVIRGAKFKDIAYVVGVLHKPLAVDIAADANFQSYAGGVFNSCSLLAITNHMVVIEGYDCEGACTFNRSGNLPKGKGTYLIRNSWGRDWGDKGYVTMKATDGWGRKCNLVANDALYFEL